MPICEKKTFIFNYKQNRYKSNCTFLSNMIILSKLYSLFLGGSIMKFQRIITLILTLTIIFSLDISSLAEDNCTYTLGCFTFRFEGNYSEITVEENRIMAYKNGGISIISVGNLDDLGLDIDSEKTGEMETLIMMLDTTVPYMDDVEPFDFGEVDGAAYLITSGTLQGGSAPTKIALVGVMRKNIMLLGMFENPDFSVSKEDAFAFVKTLKVNDEKAASDGVAMPEAYNSVLENYKKALEDGVSSYGEAYEHGVSEWIRYYYHVGYALIDLDDNKIPEMVIGGIDPKTDMSYTGPVVFEIYALSGDEPVSLFRSEARSRYYLINDNKIINSGSSGASASSTVAYRVEGGHLKFVEGLSTVNSNDSSGQRVYHTTNWKTYDYSSIPYGDYDRYDYTVPVDQLWPFLRELQTLYWMPELTQIA